MNNSYRDWAARRRVPLGFAFAVVYLIFCQPTPVLLATGGVIAFLGLTLRAFASGHLEKNQALAISGPYAFTRNPLYLGSFVLGAGFAVAGGSWPIAVAFGIFYPLIYWPVMRREEDSLRGKFARAYENYARTVPLFFPRWPGVPSSGVKFRWERYRKNHEYQAALGFAAGIIFLALKFKLR